MSVAVPGSSWRVRKGVPGTSVRLGIPAIMGGKTALQSSGAAAVADAPAISAVW